MSHIAANYDPFDESLLGEYARMLLVGTATCSATMWAIRSATDPWAFVMVMANLLVVGVAVGSLFAGLARLAILALLIIATIATVASQSDPSLWFSPVVFFSPGMTVGTLSVLVIRDGLIAVRHRPRKFPAGKVIAWTVFFAVTTYMVVIPSVDSYLEQFRERPENYVVEDLSSLEVLRVRSAKLTVFVVFAYAGACIGSFLNVVAASAPRGERIALTFVCLPKVWLKDPSPRQPFRS